jgi:hypothetical protein
VFDVFSLLLLVVLKKGEFFRDCGAVRVCSVLVVLVAVLLHLDETKKLS